MTIQLATLLFCLVVILSCSSKKSIPNAPEGIKVSPYKSSQVVDSAGSSISGVRVTMHVVYDEDKAQTPKAFVTNSYTIDYRIRIFDMFDNQVKLVVSNLSCDDNYFCSGGPPTWDKTNSNGDLVPPGLYYTNSISYFRETNRYDSSGRKTWTCLEGFIDSTDDNGVFKIPPVPINQDINIWVTSTLSRTFNGWLRFTYEKNGYVTCDDTCFFGDSIMAPAILRRQ